MAENEFFGNFFSGFNLKPKMLNRYATRDDLKKELDQKVYDVANTQGVEEAFKLKEARAGMLRNYDLLAEYENERQRVLNEARQRGQAYNEKEEAEYVQALLSFQDQFPELSNKITNVREVGPAGFQPSFFEGGLDFANPPDNKYGQSLLDGIKQGSKAAIDQKQGLLSQQQPPQEQGFFGNIGDYINEDFLGRVLAIMARPEAFTDPRGLGAGIARAGQAVFAQEKEQAAAKAKAQLEYDKIQADLQKEAIKAGGDKKLTDTVYKTIEKTTAAKRGMEAINAYRAILSSGPVGGVGGKFEKTIDRIAGLFNLGGGTTADRAQNIRQQILVDLEEALGRNNLNATEVKESLKVLSDPDTWTKSNKNLNKELDVVFRKLQSIENVGANTLEYFNYEPEAFSRKRPLHFGTRPSNR